VTSYLGLYETPPPFAPLAEHDEFILWLKGKKAEGYSVDERIAAAELERAWTVWFSDPGRDYGEGFDAVEARLKAEIVAGTRHHGCRPWLTYQ
jgi:hypothetical protein